MEDENVVWQLQKNFVLVFTSAISKFRRILNDVTRLMKLP